MDEHCEFLIKTCFVPKSMSGFNKKAPAAACSAVDRARGDQNVPFQKRRVFFQKKCMRPPATRKQLLWLPKHVKRLLILMHIDY